MTDAMSPEIPPSEEKRTASDMEVAEFFKRHITNPCKVDVGAGVIRNIRDFYIREAQRLLPTFTDPEAESMLTEEINRYNQPSK